MIDKAPRARAGMGLLEAAFGVDPHEGVVGELGAEGRLGAEAVRNKWRRKCTSPKPSGGECWGRHLTDANWGRWRCLAQRGAGTGPGDVWAVEEGPEGGGLGDEDAGEHVHNEA